MYLRANMRSTCHLVPLSLALAAGALVSGCFLFHGSDAPALDAGRPTTRPDAGLPPILDAGEIDTGTLPSCPPTGIDFACTDTGTGYVPVGVAYDLPVVVGYGGGCFCGESLECIATVEGPGRLALRAVMCAELDCDGCAPYVRASCRLPPLAEGTWHVTVNDADAMDIMVSDAVPAEGPVDRCFTSAGSGPLCPLEWRPTDDRVDQLCIPHEAVSGVPIAVELTDFCFPCGNARGSCETIRTDDDILVRPRVLPPECDVDCPAICNFEESRCFIPPLEPGEYFVHTEGLPGSASLTVSASAIPRDGSNCLSIPED